MTSPRPTTWPLLVKLDAPAPQQARGGIYAIGNFDGLHRGHQALLERARKLARQHGLPWGMLTLEPHPRDVFRPDEPVFRLSPLPMKRRLLRGLGADVLAVLPFSREMAMLEAEDFVRRFLVEGLAAKHVITGYDFHFGRGRKGDPRLMRTLGEKYGFEVSIVEQVTNENGIAPFASSAIRTHLRRGHVEAAMQELGYWWMVEGEVVAGEARGRQMGFPTVNIALPPGAEPMEGIYAMRVRPADAPPAKRPPAEVPSVDTPPENGAPHSCSSDAGAAQRADALPPMPHPSGWFGAGYVGRRPTFETDGQRVLEVHLLDFDADLYGRHLCVDFVGFIREDRKFDSMQALQEQMQADIATIRAYLSSLQENDPATRWPLGRLQHDGLL